MNKIKMELRTSNILMNAEGDLHVEGYVNKTGQLSELLGSTKKFKEKIKPGAFKNAIENRKRDIDLLAEHDSTKILASTRNGSLELREDSEGLFISADICPTTYGRDSYELIKSGIIRSMSFGFKALKDSWSKMNGTAIRTVEKLELFEVSVVKNPAYTQSSLAARSIELAEVEVPTEISENLENRKDDNIMEMKKMETRNDFTLADVIRGVETRDLQTTVEGSTLIPSEVSSQIILKMEEVSPVFAMSTKLESVAGYLRVNKELGVPAAGGFIAEGTNVAEIELNLGEVKLTQKRVGAAISLSNQLINDSGVDLESYATNMLARRLAKVIEKSILTGSETTEFRGVINDADVKPVDGGAAVTLDSLVDLYLAIHPDFLNNAAFVMQRSLFNNVAKMEDGNKHKYVQMGVVNGKLQYTVLGMPVYITESLPATTPVVFGNFTEGYDVMIKKGLGITKVVADTTQALRGSQLILLDGYMDGAVVNPQAFAKLTITV